MICDIAVKLNSPPRQAEGNLLHESAYNTDCAHALFLHRLNPGELSGAIHRAVEAAVERGDMVADKGAALLRQYNRHLRTYTYLDLHH